MDNSIDIRTTQKPIQEVRQEDGNMPILQGYAVVWETFSKDLGGFWEKFKAGAFGTISPEVAALWSHDSRYVLGRVRSKTLTLVQDEVGLAFTITPPDTQWARDFITSIRRGDIIGMSFGFSMENGEDEWFTEEGKLIRYVKRAQLIEISPVAFPAFTASYVTLRALDRYRQEADRAQQQGRAPSLARSYLAIEHLRRTK